MGFIETRFNSILNIRFKTHVDNFGKDPSRAKTMTSLQLSNLVKETEIIKENSQFNSQINSQFNSQINSLTSVKSQSQFIN